MQSFLLQGGRGCPGRGGDDLQAEPPRKEGDDPLSAAQVMRPLLPPSLPPSFEVMPTVILGLPRGLKCRNAGSVSSRLMLTSRICGPRTGSRARWTWSGCRGSWCDSLAHTPGVDRAIRPMQRLHPSLVILGHFLTMFRAASEGGRVAARKAGGA